MDVYFRSCPRDVQVTTIIFRHSTRNFLYDHGSGGILPSYRWPVAALSLGVLYSGAQKGNPAQVRFLRFPYQQITATTEAIDDPQSRYYNRIVDRAAIARSDWSSSESMSRVGGPYRCGIMIEHNWWPRPGFGSCIFLHVWDSARRGTVGCTAVSPTHLEQLLHWLDGQENPLIVQLPSPEYFRLRQFWELP